MRWYTVKVYKGCPVPTALWNIVSMVSCVSGVSGLLCLYYVFFPREDTNPAFVLAGAAIGIPLFILCLLLRKPIDKLGEKQLKERAQKESAKKESAGSEEQNVYTYAFRGKRAASKPQNTNTFIAFGFVMMVFIFCIFYRLLL